MTNPSERRRQNRVNVHWPVQLSRDESDIPIETLTENVSSQGFYCETEQVFSPGESLRCTLRVPTWVPVEPRQMLILKCRVKVQWVCVIDSKKQFGVGCRIEDYSVVSQSTSGAAGAAWPS